MLVMLGIIVVVTLLGLGHCDITGTNPPAGTCLCLNNNGVNVRNGACGSVIGQGNSGECHLYQGTKQGCTLSGTYYEYFRLSCGSSSGTQAWIAGTYLNTGSASSCQPAVDMNGNCDEVEIVSRATWGARPPTSRTPLSTPVSAVFIHHTVTSRCYDVSACSVQLRNMQNYHMDSLGWWDIGYNFLVGDDGRAYEGRGFDTVGTHTGNWNSYSVAISMIGDYTSVLPTTAALRTVRHLINCAQRANQVSSQYQLWGHRDAMSTACPGNLMYAEIKKWPDYSCTAATYRGVMLEDYNAEYVV